MAESSSAAGRLSAEYYLERAADCRAVASMMVSSTARRHLLKLEQTYLELAAELLADRERRAVDRTGGQKA